MSEGKMSSFAKLRQGGAYGRLRSQEPMLSPILWTTIATGKPPSEHARRGDSAAAIRKLDQAERIAPKLSLVRQYRRNVAYLWGDEGANRAALEPDNALYRESLRRLRQRPKPAPSPERRSVRSARASGSSASRLPAETA